MHSGTTSSLIYELNQKIISTTDSIGTNKHKQGVLTRYAAMHRAFVLPGPQTMHYIASALQVTDMRVQTQWSPRVDDSKIKTSKLEDLVPIAGTISIELGRGPEWTQQSWQWRR